jgi:hypothetical protein|tara:strand:+ start:138 stop:953 length:816 start_codon:yes stop_codon:yes gene_type:complete
MILFRAFINNKAVTNRVYWAGSEDSETVAIKKEVTDVFTSETFPYPVNIWGVDMNANVITFHQCSVEQDYKDSSKMQNSLLIDKDFMRYIYNLDTKTKTIEIFYKPDQAIPVVSLGSGVSVYRISDMCDADFNLQKTQAIYAQGTNANIFAWAKSLKSDIVMPISESKKLHADDSYKFQFNAAGELQSVELFAHLDRVMVYGVGDSLYTEYSADFADELSNLADTEIVVPKFDNNGNRVAQEVNKENIKEYVMVPKSDGSGGYDKVLAKDL